MWEGCKKNIRVVVRWSQRPYSAQPPSFRGELPFRYPAALRRHSIPNGILINLTWDPCVLLNIDFFFFFCPAISRKAQDTDSRTLWPRVKRECEWILSIADKLYYRAKRNNPKSLCAMSPTLYLSSVVRAHNLRDNPLRSGFSETWRHPYLLVLGHRSSWIIFCIK